MQKLIRAAALIAIMGFAEAADADQPLPFEIGENLHYRVYWGILEVGSATLQVREMTEIDGHQTYHIVGTIVSNSFLSKLYPVRSSVETFLDVNGLFTRKFIESRHEGKYRREREITFNYEKGQGSIKTQGKSVVKTFELKEDVQDPFSSVYYLRTQPLLPDSTRTFAALGSHGTCVVAIASHERQNIALGKLGTFPAIRLEPSADYESIFSRRGAMSVWVSADKRKIPLVMIAKISVGHIKAVLSGFEGIIKDGGAPSAGRNPLRKTSDSSILPWLLPRVGI